MCHATGEPDWYADRVREVLLSPEPDADFAWHQLSELAARFVRMGRDDLRPAIYHRLSQILANGGDAGATTVVWLEGAQGYRFLLEQTAHLPPSGDDNATWFLSVLIDRVGETGAKGLSEQLANESPQVFEPYLTRAWTERADSEARRAAWKKQPELERLRTPLDYDSLLAWVRAPNDRATSTRFSPFTSKRIDAAVAERLATNLLVESDPVRQIRLLRIFAERAFPLSISPLLPLVYSENEKLAWQALRVLRNVHDPAVRSLGRELINDFDRAHWGPMLLVLNPGAGDLELFRSLLQRPFDDDALHRIGFDLYDYFKANPAVPAADCLVRLYERGPCSRCRNDVVEMLIARIELPERLYRECRYDAHDKTRQLVSSLT